MNEYLELKMFITYQISISEIGLESKLGGVGTVGHAESLQTGESKGSVGIVTHNSKYDDLYPDAIGVDRNLLIHVGDMMVGHVG